MVDVAWKFANTMEDHDIKHPPHRSASENVAAAASASNHGITIELPSGVHDGRPLLVKHMSAPAYQSPLRHHKRVPSRSRGVKETLDAQSHYGSNDDEGGGIHRINQYSIKQEIGRGSFGAVHLAVDQYGNEFAVKEFSKSRLRKRAQSNLLRKPNHARRPGQLAAGLGFNSPLHRLSSHDRSNSGDNNALDLIKEEIAIMKKLDHNNLVSLIEVLDDPDEDSLYMVLEMCKKGVVMKVGLEERADPYEGEACRCWFRDMILGIEYLHAQGIIHRDIKPDNCLITHDDVLKIVDFGVSEMFEKESDMATAKSAGSPAFMPPELCVAKHGQVSGRAADIWSMGVTLYCLRYGHIPFEKTGMLELYESIRNDELFLENEQDQNFRDLMHRILEKNPEKRITMEQLRIHPWVTKSGNDPLLSAEENCADLVEAPTEDELNQAITGNMGRLMVVMRAVKRFKDLVARKHGALMEGFFGRDSRIVAPPASVLSQGTELRNGRPVEHPVLGDGIPRNLGIDDQINKTSAEFDRVTVQSPPPMDDMEAAPRLLGESEAHWKQRQETGAHRLPEVNPKDHQGSGDEGWRGFSYDDHGKGHAHDPLTDTLYLDIGASADMSDGPADALHPVVSESPGGIEFNVYERAYQEEIDRIMKHQGHSASLHLTRRVEHIEDLRSHPNIIPSSITRMRSPVGAFAALAGKTGGSASGGLAALVRQAKHKAESTDDSTDPRPGIEQGEETVAGGLVNDEDHIPTNETAFGGVDSGPAFLGASDPSRVARSPSDEALNAHVASMTGIMTGLPKPS